MKATHITLQSGDQVAPGRDIRRILEPRRLVRFVIFTLVFVALGTFGWLAYRANAALNQISTAEGEGGGGLFQFLKKQDDALLDGESDGRINILILGMGGRGHPGGSLTDTIMIVSLAPKEEKAALISLPRDLYVPIPKHGWGKLNSAHAIGEQTKAGEGPMLAKQTVADVTGLPIHYYIRIDFKGFIDLVDALGGLDIDVERAINDPYFPDEKLEGYEPFYLKAGRTHMNGELALKYARSRETTSDFDRARRQQQLLSAIKDKALSPTILLNPKKLTEFLAILGNHVRTDLAVWEMERLLELAPHIDTSKLVNRVFDTAAGSPLISKTDPTAGYIIVPRSGNFDALQAEIRAIFESDDAKLATIAIENASGNPELGGNVALLLRGYGYQVLSVSTARSSRTTSQLLTQDIARFPALQKFLRERFGVIAETTTRSLQTDFLLVIGKDYAG